LKAAVEARPDVAVIALARSNDPETILQCLRAGASEFLSSPFPPNDLRQAVQRIGRRQIAEASPTAGKRGRLIVFSPVKGGAGSTTLATNVAFAIKRESRVRVLLADLSLSAGIVGFLLRLQTPYSALDALRHASQLDDALWKSLVVSHEGVDILVAPERPEPALIESFPAEEMFEFCRSMYDYIVADLGGVCEGLGLTAATAADSISLVCSTDMPSLFMMRRTIPLLEEMGRSRDQLNVLVNRVERRSDLSVEDMEKIFRASVHSTFPEDAAAVLRAQREGALVAESSDLGRSVRRFARSLLGVKPKEAAGALGTLRQLWSRA
jgi:pilus assembly protein CpaE